MPGLIRLSLLRQIRFYLLWGSLLSLTITTLLIVDIFRGSLQSALHRHGRKMLAADVTLSSRNSWSESELEKISKLKSSVDASAEASHVVAMLASGQNSRLSEIHFVSESYPLAGELTGKDQDEKIVNIYQHLKANEIWLDANLALTLNARPGDVLRLGKSHFIMKGVIVKDSTQSFRFAGFIPDAYARLETLAATQLIRIGSTQANFIYFATDDPIELKKQINQLLPDPTLRVQDPQDLERGALRVFGRLFEFLGLIGLSTLILGWVGVYFLLQRWLQLERAPIGILKCLGFTSREALQHLMTKLVIITTIAAWVSGVAAYFIAELIGAKLQSSLPTDFSVSWTFSNFILMLAVGPLSALMLGILPANALTSQPGMDLTQSYEPTTAFKSIWWQGALIFVGIALLAWLQTRSFQVMGIFAAAHVGAWALVMFVTWCVTRFLTGIRAQLKSWVAMVTIGIWLSRKATVAIFVLLSALSIMLTQLVPHIEKSLIGELQETKNLVRPSLFIVDVQEDQLPDLEAQMQSIGVEESDRAPMIRARLLSINEEAVEREDANQAMTREQENEMRFRNRGVNLSYRSMLTRGDEITSGKDWSAHSLEPPEVSIETSFARRLGIQIGDRLKFDVQGVEITAQVASLREIRWSRFEPGFFILFPEGVLNESPKSWIVTTKPSDHMTPLATQQNLVQHFPNLSILDVNEILTTLIRWISQISIVLQLTALTTLILGLIVYLTILGFQISTTRHEWRQLHTLGVDNISLRWVIFLTYGSLVIAGAFIGAGLAGALTWGLTNYALNTATDFNISLSIGSLVLLIMSVVALTYFSPRAFVRS